MSRWRFHELEKVRGHEPHVLLVVFKMPLVNACDPTYEMRVEQAGVRLSCSDAATSRTGPRHEQAVCTVFRASTGCIYGLLYGPCYGLSTASLHHPLEPLYRRESPPRPPLEPATSGEAARDPDHPHVLAPAHRPRRGSGRETGGYPMTPMLLKAIRACCLWCSLEGRSEVRLCPSRVCAPWPCRLGHNPKRQRQADSGLRGGPEVNCSACALREAQGLASEDLRRPCLPGVPIARGEALEFDFWSTQGGRLSRR